MTKRVYCREAIYREEYIVDVPDNLPEEEWEEYVLEELKALDRDPDDTKFSEYLAGAWFTDTWLTENSPSQEGKHPPFSMLTCGYSMCCALTTQRGCAIIGLQRKGHG